MPVPSENEESVQSEEPRPLPTHITYDTPSVEVQAAILNSDEGSDSDADSAEMAEIVESTSQDSATMSKDTAPVLPMNIAMSPRVRSLQRIHQLEETFEHGYDSDGECGPFVRMEDIEGDQIFVEEELEGNDRRRIVYIHDGYKR